MNNKKEEWQYIVMPGMVGRMTDEDLEIIQFDNDQWVSVKDPAYRKLLTTNGMVVSQEEALEVYATFKEQNEEYKSKHSTS